MSQIFKTISRIFSKNQRSTHSYESSSEQASSLESHCSNFSKPEKVNILNLLPLELTELVLIHLDINSLKSCMEASRSLRDAIIHSQATIKKFKLKLTDKNWKSKVPFIEKYGKCIRNVEIECCDEFCMHSLYLLRLMPNVTKLKFSLVVKLCENNNNKDEQGDIGIEKMISLLNCTQDKKSNLEKLENLEYFIYNEDFRFDMDQIFFDELLCCKNLTKICVCNRVANSSYLYPLGPFLCQQDHLEHLELEVFDVGSIFSEKSVDKMNFKLKSLMIITFTDYFHMFTYFDLVKFLLAQSDCLEELQTFPQLFEKQIIEGISKLKNLKKLTTDGLLPWFKKQQEPQSSANNDANPIFLQHLKYFRCYKENKNEDFDEIDTSRFPNLECVNLRSGSNKKLTENPLRNLMQLKEFHIDSHDQDLLKFLASPNLEALVIPFDKVLYDFKSWMQMAKKLPNLQHLTIVDIKFEKFLKFVIENHENLIQIMKRSTENEGLKILELHFCSFDALKLLITNGEELKTSGCYCDFDGILCSNRKLLERKFKKFDLRLITREEYDLKLNFWDSFRVPIPYERGPYCQWG